MNEYKTALPERNFNLAHLELTRNYRKLKETERTNKQIQ